jgi:hypothetical protein
MGQASSTKRRPERDWSTWGRCSGEGRCTGTLLRPHWGCWRRRLTAAHAHKLHCGNACFTVSLPLAPMCSAVSSSSSCLG